MDDLKQILYPLTEKEFFSHYFDQKPVHISGTSDKFSDLMSWEILNNLLNMKGIWSSHSLRLVREGKPLEPLSYCIPDGCYNMTTGS